MKFGRKRRKKSNTEQSLNRRIRKEIWEEPAIIEELFADEQWNAYDGTDQSRIPSQDMHRRIKEEIGKQEKQDERKEMRFYRSNAAIQIGIAATLLLFISFNIWYWSDTNDDKGNVSYTEKGTLAEGKAESLWVTTTNDTDNVDTIYLPDQSVVHLSANSSIRYASKMPATEREIYLNGEAYFSVRKDSSRPFSVFAGGTKTTALGTSFTINTGTKGSQTSVELHTGKVVVASTESKPAFEQVFLDNQGDRLLYDTQSRIAKHLDKHKKSGSPVARSSQSTHNDGRLVLENVPLPEVFDKLAKNYRVDIIIKDQAISKILYTGTIDPSREKIENVLSVICLINDLRYVLEEDGSYSIHR